MPTLAKKTNRKKIAQIPDISNFTEVLFYIKNNDINWTYFNYFKELTGLSDELISKWLNINSKTLRAYRKPDSISKDNLKEHLVLLISLFEHGIDVFDTTENFDKWLLTGNFYLDNNPPKDFLDTITGIKFIDDRLTAMEYGDNV